MEERERERVASINLFLTVTDIYFNYCSFFFKMSDRTKFEESEKEISIKKRKREKERIERERRKEQRKKE